MRGSYERLLAVTRRHFLSGAAGGLGALALSSLTGEGRAEPGGTSAADNPFAPRPSHFAAKAKSVIWLHMAGSPPHLDMFDYKPELVRRTGEDCPESLLKGKRFAFTGGTPKLLGTPQEFKQYGQSGAWVS